MASDAGDAEALLERACGGDQQALGQLLSAHRDRLHLMVRLRLDRRLTGRIDPSDVIQEAYLEATERFGDYLHDRTMPFYLWLRFLTAQRLLILHRHHLKAQVRAAGREQPLGATAGPEATSAALADILAASLLSPSQAAARAETQGRLQAALESMDPTDREVLVLRHFEQLSNAETAQALGIRADAASQRYVRALRRLKEILASLPGFGG